MFMVPGSASRWQSPVVEVVKVGLCPLCALGTGLYSGDEMWERVQFPPQLLMSKREVYILIWAAYVLGGLSAVVMLRVMAAL